MGPTLRDLRPREYWRRFATEKRILTAVRILIDSSDADSFTIWPFDSDMRSTVVRLVDTKENWLSVKKGSSVIVRANGASVLRQIREVRLHDVSPLKYCGLEVPSAIDWLDGVPALHKSNLPDFSDGIPCDLRGYIPTEETGPFDLDWPYRRPTHRYNGAKTPYGELWEADWPALKAKAIMLTAIALGFPPMRQSNMIFAAQTG